MSLGKLHTLLQGLRLTMLHKIFYIIHVTPISLNKISVQYQKTNLTKANLASFIKSEEMQLLNQFFNKSDEYLLVAQHSHVQRERTIRFTDEEKVKLKNAKC